MNFLVEKLARRDALNTEERRILEALPARIDTVARGTSIVRQGDRPTECRFVVEGFVARYKLLADGGRQITAVHVPGDFVDLHSLLIKVMDHGIVALTPCRIAAVPHERVQDITERHPHLTRLLWLNTLIDGAIHREWLVSLGRYQAPAQMGRLFCELYLRLETVGLARDGRYSFPLTQEEIGDVLGLSTVHVNRVLQELRRDGLITLQGGSLAIHDWDRLVRVSEFDPAYLNLHAEPR